MKKEKDKNNKFIEFGGERSIQEINLFIDAKAKCRHCCFWGNNCISSRSFVTEGGDVRRRRIFVKIEEAGDDLKNFLNPHTVDCNEHCICQTRHKTLYVKSRA